MLISLTAFMGSKPAASYFKRDFCTAYLHQKVPKKSELFDHKKSSHTIFLGSIINVGVDARKERSTPNIFDIKK